jgi:hypothetical protein
MVTVPDPAPREYRNIFTGELVSVVARGDRQGLPLADVFARCPLALLEPKG